MLSFRHLHSCAQQNGKLLVKNIVETYDYNGLKTNVNKKQRKEHPYYSNFILKDVIKKVPKVKNKSNDSGIDVNVSHNADDITRAKIHRVSSESDVLTTEVVTTTETLKTDILTPDPEPEDARKSKQDTGLDINENHDGISKPEILTQAVAKTEVLPPDVLPSDSKNTRKATKLECLSLYMSEESNLNLKRHRSIAEDDTTYSMSYSEFQSLYYVKNFVRKERKRHIFSGASGTICFSGKCNICNRMFESKVALSKHKVLCKVKRDKKVAVKNYAKQIVKKVKKTKVSKPAALLYHCSKCTDRFVSKNTLEIHMKYDHRPRPTCGQCFKMFDCRRKLINHESTCTGLEQGEPTKKLTIGVIDFKTTSEISLCSKCENPFPSKDDLRQHKIILNKRNPLPIELDNNSVMNVDESLQIYVKKNPVYFKVTRLNVYIPNSCLKCGKSFRNNIRLNQHAMFCHEKSLKTCPYCLKKFRGAYQRNQHLDFCSEKSKKDNLQVPVKVIRTETIGSFSYTCSNCETLFTNKSDLNKHLHELHDQQYCAKCDDTTKRNVLHYAGVHECLFKMNKIYTSAKDVPSSGLCELCGEIIKVFPFSKPFKHCCPVDTRYNEKVKIKKVVKHFSETPPITKTIKQNIKKKFHCSHCKKRFYTKRRLRCHKSTSTCQNRLCCGFCPGKTFTKNIKYYQHLRQQHGKKFCIKCNEIYLYTAKNHKCSEKKRNNYSKDTYTCYVCKKICGNKWRMIEHLVTHSDRHPYACKKCPRTYKYVNALKKHGLEAHGIAMHIKSKLPVFQKLHDIVECNKCGNVFLGRHDIKQHNCEFSDTHVDVDVEKYSDETKAVDVEILSSDDESLSVIQKNLSKVNKKTSNLCKLCKCSNVNMSDKVFQNSSDKELCLSCSDTLPLNDVEDEDDLLLQYIKQPDHLCTTILNTDNSSTETNNKLLSTNSRKVYRTRHSLSCEQVQLDKPTCSYCMKTFHYNASLKSHLKVCLKKELAIDNVIKPVGPSLEACLNVPVNFERIKEEEHVESDIMSLQEAQQTLLSLFIDDEYQIDTAVITPAEQQNSDEHHTDAAAITTTEQQNNAEYPTDAASITTTEQQNNDAISRTSSDNPSPMDYLSILLSQESIPIYICESQSTQCSSSVAKDTICSDSINDDGVIPAPSVAKDLIRSDGFNDGSVISVSNVVEDTICDGIEDGSITPVSNMAENDGIDTNESSNESLQNLSVYPCQKCDINFDTELSLEYHKENIHIESLPVSSTRVVELRRKKQKLYEEDVIENAPCKKKTRINNHRFQSRHTTELHTGKTHEHIHTIKKRSKHKHSIQDKDIETTVHNVTPTMCGVKRIPFTGYKLDKPVHSDQLTSDDHNVTTLNLNANSKVKEYVEGKIENVHQVDISTNIEVQQQSHDNTKITPFKIVINNHDINEVNSYQQLEERTLLEQLTFQNGNLLTSVQSKPHRPSYDDQNQKRTSKVLSSSPLTIHDQQTSLKPDMSNNISQTVTSKPRRYSYDDQNQKAINKISPSLTTHDQQTSLKPDTSNSLSPTVKFKPRRHSYDDLNQTTTSIRTCDNQNQKGNGRMLSSTSSSCDLQTGVKPAAPSKLRRHSYEETKRYKAKAKLKPREREQSILKNMVQLAAERKDITSQNSIQQKKAGMVAGAEYNHGISNYFTDIMLKTKTKDNQDSAYLNALRHRIQKQFESEGFSKSHDVKHNNQTSIHRRKQQHPRTVKNVNGNHPPKTLVSSKTVNGNHPPNIPVSSKSRSINGEKTVITKPKLVFNKQSLEDLRLKRQQMRKKMESVGTVAVVNDLKEKHDVENESGCVIVSKVKNDQDSNKVERNAFSFLEDY